MIGREILGYADEVITKEQSRAARALTGLDQEDLARLANVSARTVMRFENGQTSPHRAVMIAIERALIEGGVEFIDEDESGGPGVRLRKTR